MKKEYLQLLEGYKLWLEIKNYKERGIEGKLRSAKYFFIYQEENNMDTLTFNIKDAEDYRKYLVTCRDKESNTRLSPASVNHIMSELRLLYKYLIGISKALRNPFMNIDSLMESRKLPRNILDIKKMGKLLKNIEVKDLLDFKFKVVLEVLYSTACRISEVENLERKNIDLDRGIITIIDDKERKDRITPLTEYAVKVLKVYLDNNDKENPFTHGKKRTLNRFMNDRLKRITNKLNLPSITCHCIRHTIASQMLKKGADIREVQELLGHKRIKNTEVYTRLMTEDLKKIVDKLHPREKGECEE